MKKSLFCFLFLITFAMSVFADSNDMTDWPVPGSPSPQLLVGDFSFFGPCFGGNYCSYNPGSDGSPASGFGNDNANASGSAAIAYNFYTGLPLTWTDTGYSYSATFGLGGVFHMSLPDGLTFTGVVTSGTSGYEGLTSEVEVNYAGQWSNGQYATGSVDEHELGFGPYQGLSEMTNLGASQSTPEPSSFLLMGTGLVGLRGWIRRGRRKALDGGGHLQLGHIARTGEDGGFEGAQ